MKQLRVWAPDKNCVKVVISGSESQMDRQETGWWTASVPEGPLEYAFVVDGGKPLPDPRSAWQPFGVHGQSRTVDHESFAWSDGAWQAIPLGSAVIYELHTGTFTAEGTFDAAMGRIPHLASLGITHVELMPVVEFPGDWGWGYDGVDLYAPHHTYGGPDGLKRLVNALHKSGIAVLLDVVYNHLGPSGNYLSQYGPYFTNRFKTPWGEAVNLSEAGSGEVRNFFVDNALMWLRDYHFDGLRLDAVHTMMDTSATHFLEELSVKVRQLEAEVGRPLCLVAESDLNDPRLIRPTEEGGYGLTAQWSDDYHHALHSLLTGEARGYYADFGRLRDLAKAIEKGFVYDGQYSVYRGRRHGRELDPAQKSRLVCCLQNHDQVGNRATGDRITAQTDTDRVKIGAALVLLGPFIPLLFQGEEWGASTPFSYFTNHQEPKLARAVSEGRRREFRAFGWSSAAIPDPQDPLTFEHSKLNWAEAAEAPHKEMLDWYRQVIALRKKHPEFQSPEAKAIFREAEDVLIMERGGMSVICNLSRAVRTVRLSSHTSFLLRSSAETRHEREAIVLAPSSVTIVAVRRQVFAPTFSSGAELATA